MNIVNAFLAVTAITFFFGTVYPKSVTFFSKPVERLVFLIQGIALIAALFFNNGWFWLLLGGVWTSFVGLDYVGAIRYRVFGKESVTAQMFMTAWDLLIAVACLVKA